MYTQQVRIIERREYRVQLWAIINYCPYPRRARTGVLSTYNINAEHASRYSQSTILNCRIIAVLLQIEHTNKTAKSSLLNRLINEYLSSLAMTGGNRLNCAVRLE